MWRYPDGTIRQTPPARVEYAGYVRYFAELTPAQRDELGFNEAVPLKREPFTAYEIEWVRGEDLIYRETAVSATVDEAGRSAAEAATMRAERNRLLAASDWTQVPDTPLAEEALTEWRTYRQALRDVPGQAGFPGSVTWPGEPAA